MYNDFENLKAKGGAWNHPRLTELEYRILSAAHTWAKAKGALH